MLGEYPIDVVLVAMDLEASEGLLWQQSRLEDPQR